MSLYLLYSVSALIIGMIGYLIGSGKISLKPQVILSIAFLFLIPVIINFLVFVYSSTSPEIFTPSVLSMQGEEAIRTLEDAGLKGEIIGVTFSNEPQGSVISQQPEAGKKVKTGRLVRLIISAKGTTIPVPSVVGRSSDEAKSILFAAGLKVANIYGIPSTEAFGTVVEQVPQASEMVAPNSNVSVTISLGQE